MSERTIRDDAAPIYCSTDTRELVRDLKRGGETYDELVVKMARQHERSESDV